MTPNLCYYEAIVLRVNMYLSEGAIRFTGPVSLIP